MYYAYLSKERLPEQLVLIKDAYKFNKETDFFCPDADCSARMRIWNVSGFNKAYFRAMSNRYGHSPECNYKKNYRQYNRNEYDEKAFDFDFAIDRIINSTSEASVSTEQKSCKKNQGEPRPLSTIGQIYSMCKCYAPCDEYNGRKIGTMLLDNRSLSMYPRGVFGKKLVELQRKKKQYFYETKREEFLFRLGDYTFIIKVTNPILFQKARKLLFEHEEYLVVFLGDWSKYRDSAGRERFNWFEMNMRAKAQLKVLKQRKNND